MKRHFKTRGFVIRKIKFGDADQIVTLLTSGNEKIHCIAKGSRKITSKFCGRLELCHELEVTGYKGRELGYLREAEVLTGSALFNLPLRAHCVLACIAETSNRLIQDGQATEGVYELLAKSLESLAKKHDPGSVLKTYISRLLELLGFMAPQPEKAWEVLKTVLPRPLKSEKFLEIKSWSG